jgi:hypothetical protein
MAEVVTAYVDSRWATAGSKEYDMALLVLREPVGQERGYSGLWWTDADELNRNTLVNITGYCGDAGKSGHMLTMSHYLDYCASEYLYYQIDTSSGQSGSPIVVVRETPEGTNPYIVGVHAYGDERLRRNFGIRLSQSRFDWLVDLINRTNGAFIPRADPLPSNIFFYDGAALAVQTNQIRTSAPDFLSSFSPVEQDAIRDFQKKLDGKWREMDDQQRNIIVKTALPAAIVAVVAPEKRALISSQLTVAMLFMRGSLKAPENKLLISSIAQQGSENAKRLAEILISSIDDQDA